jgi:peptidoglycan/LPS O-acetylase OafA/YrhL
LIVRIAMRLGGANPDMVYEFTVCRMDALALGALAAVAVRTPTVFSNLRHRAAWLMPSALMLLLVGATFTRAYARDGFWTQTAGQSLLAIVSGLLILACLMDRTGVNGWVQRIFASPVLRSLGKYSYGMYVIHLPLELILKRDPWYAHGNSGILAYGGAILGASYLAAVLSYHLIEKHFLKLKDRFVPQTLERAPKGVPHAAADC